MSTTWRPQQHVRPLAIGIIRRGEELSVVAVQEDSGALKGWRPLGGRIEFGERAADTLRREFVEELGLKITNPQLLTAMENLYEHHGVRGHEVVFVFATAFEDQAGYRMVARTANRTARTLHRPAMKSPKCALVFPKKNIDPGQRSLARMGCRPYPLGRDTLPNPPVV